MASAREASRFARPGSVDRCIDLRDVDWDGYQSVLEIRGGQRRPRILYLDGSLTFVSPSMPHESISRRLGLFVPEVALGLGINFSGIGSTTIGREALNCGVEGDQAFYFANFDRIRGKREIDLNVDPPPDLAIEVVITHSAKRAMEVYRRLGVPELWLCTEKRLRFLLLGEGDAYHDSEVSRSLPFLSAAEIFDWVAGPMIESEYEWLSRLRAWVRDELAPRARGGEAGAGG